MYKKASTEPRMSRRQSYIISFRIEECEPELLIDGVRDTMKKTTVRKNHQQRWDIRRIVEGKW